MTGRRRTMLRAAGAAAVALLAVGVPAAAAPAARAGAATPHTTTPVYQLSLGDSLAAGVGASTPANSYVDLVGAHEAAVIPGLTVENLGCGGATTNSMINGPGCSYTTGTQLGDAEAFLRAHAGQMAYVTIDIGANNVDGCVTGGTLNLGCLANGLSQIQTQLPQIVAGLHAAGPGVPILGMDYYDPFLFEWVFGGAGGPALATESASLSAVLNSQLTKLYGAGGAIAVDVQGAFATQDFSPTGTFNGQTVPENVGRICAWTHMCDSPPGNIHANDIGHAKLALAFERTLDQVLAPAGAWLASADGAVNAEVTAAYGSMAGTPLRAPVVGMARTADGRGYWLVAADGGVFAFGDAGFYGSAGGLSLAAPIVGMAPTSDDGGYWLVAADGGVFAYGDAGFLGSMGGHPLNRPVVGLAQTGSDQGYWLVASDGGVFAFGDAGFDGSAAGVDLNRPVVGVAATVDGNGYWLVASDGGVFAYGDALFHGAGTTGPGEGASIGMAVAPGGYGYTLGTDQATLTAFGNAVLPHLPAGLTASAAFPPPVAFTTFGLQT